MPDTFPQRIGKYDITDLLGQGAMGVVYRGLDPHLGRYVAVKVMSQGIATDQELRDRFLREARAAGSLQHPNIITIFDFGEAEGSLYIAMEYVEGSDLSQIIDRQDPLPLTGKIDIMVDVLHALDYAHHRGVVHRDVKPANIRVSVDGRAKLMDFGIARLEKSDLTKSGIMIGTPDYMAPEQITGGTITPATDVFAVGSVLYEFLTNQRSFHGQTIHEVLYKVVSEQPPPLRDVVKSIPGSLQPILDKALAKDPAQRYASAGLMARDLAAVRTALGGAVTIAVASRATPIRTARLPAHLRPRKGWRRPVVWAGGGALVLAALAAVFVGGPLLRPASPPAAAPAGATAVPAGRTADSVGVAAATSVPLAPAPESARIEPSPVPQPQGQPAPHLGGARTALANLGHRNAAGRREESAPPGEPAGRASGGQAAAPAGAVPLPQLAPTVTTPVQIAPPPAVPVPAPSAPAPAQPAPSPERAAPVDPRPQIEALVSAYARAIENKSLDEMRRVYPALRSDQRDGWSTLFSHARGAVKAELALADVEVTGATAAVEVSGHLEYDVGGGTQRPQYSFHATAALEGGAWRFKVIP